MALQLELMLKKPLVNKEKRTFLLSLRFLIGKQDNLIIGFVY